MPTEQPKKKRDQRLDDILLHRIYVYITELFQRNIQFRKNRYKPIFWVLTVNSRWKFLISDFVAMRRCTCYFFLAILFIFNGAYGSDDEEDFCKEYLYGAKPIASEEKGVTGSVFSINHAYPLGDVIVPVTILHPRIEDVIVTLSAEAERVPGAKRRMIKRVLLKDAGQGSGNNMSVVFTDAADQKTSNSNAHPMKPVQSLSFLYGNMGHPSVVAASGGTQGTWTLRVEDTAKDESIRIDPVIDWSLILCQISTSSSDGQVESIAENPTSGQAISDALQAFAGKPQPIAWAVNAGPDKDIEFADNFDSYLNTMNNDCGTPEKCNALKQRMWKSAAALMYMGMKDHLDNDASRSRLSNLLEMFSNRTKLGEQDEKNRWKPGQYLSSLVDGASNVAQQLKEQSQGIFSSLGNTVSALPAVNTIQPFGDKPDKVIWSRALTLNDIADTVRSAKVDLDKKLDLWQPSAKVKSMLQNDRSLPDFSDIQSNLGSIASKISEKSQNWMEEHSTNRANFLASIDSNLEQAQSKLASRISELSDWQPKLPDLSGIKDKLEQSRSQLKSNLKDLQMPAENFKQKFGTAVENTVRKQLETAMSDENLGRIADAISKSDLNGTKSLRSFQGSDLSGLIPDGLNLNFKNGLKLDGPLGEELVGQLLGIEDPEETKALLEGLKEAGFQDLMTEFLNPALR